MRWRVLALGMLLAIGCERGGTAGHAQSASAAQPLPLPAKLDVALAWATYWGAPGGSALRSAVFDAAGNLYIAGGTERAAEWPQTAPAAGPLGDFDVIVAKFDPAGRSLWSIVVGGTGEDYAYVSALDSAGNLVVGGRGGPAFPVTPGAYDGSFNGGFGRGSHSPTDGFLLSLTPDGALRWATYIGSSGDDVIRGIEILPDGGIAVSGGNTDRGDLSTTPGVVKPALGGDKDAWVGVIAPDGASARFVTYVGPSDDTDTGDETIRAIGLDPNGNLWIGGTTEGTDLAPTPDAQQPERRGGSSAFVAKLSRDGRAMPYFSWLGGSAEEDVETEGITEAGGGFGLAGGTESGDFPTTPGAFAQGSGSDGWVARFGPNGKLEMAARFGGSSADHFFGPARGGAGELYAGGTTASTDLPVTEGALQLEPRGGASDALLAAFDREGALAYATYFGGSGVDAGRFVASDATRGRVALIGETTSSDLTLKDAAQTQPGAVYVAVFATPRTEVAPASAPEAQATAE